MTWVAANLDTIATAAWSHLMLSVPAIVAAFLLSLPIAWVAHRHRWTSFTLVTASSLLYAIPSLPLLIVLPMITGAGVRDPLNVVVALTLYGVALMVRAGRDALAAVPAGAVTAAVALGYSPIRRFLGVELPLAGPGLLAGLRVVAVSTVALVTVSAVLGVDSLGMLFIDGFQRGILAEIVAGIVLTVALALAVDALLVGLGRLLLPWAAKGAAR